MHFRVEQRFAATIDEVIDAYTDPGFYLRLDALDKIGQPKVLGRTATNGLVTMRVHYAFTANLPSAALAVIDPAKLTWVDETVYNLETSSSTTRLLPDHYRDRLTASATSSFSVDPANSGHCRRHIVGELKVRMPIVARKVEQAIFEGLEEHLADETRVVNLHLGR